MIKDEKAEMWHQYLEGLKKLHLAPIWITVPTKKNEALIVTNTCKEARPQAPKIRWNVLAIKEDQQRRM